MKKIIEFIKEKRFIFIIVLVVIYLVAIIWISIDNNKKIKIAENTKALTTEENLADNGLNLSITPELSYADGVLTGIVTVVNNGAEIDNISSGTYPVNVGISVIDASGRIVDNDMAHISIKDGSLGSGESVDVPVNIGNLEQYPSDYGIRVCVVQEGIAWVDSTAKIVWFDPSKNTDN